MRHTFKDNLISVIIGIIIAIPMVIYLVNYRIIDTEVAETTIETTTEQETTTEEPTTEETTKEETPTEEETTTEQETTFIFTTYDFIPLSADLQEDIYNLSLKYEINYDFILGWIKTESSFITDIVGDNGNAYGLMQIWEYWHGETARALGLDIKEPIDNVELALVLLTRYLEGSGGSMDASLAAYSGDPSGAYAERVYNNYSWVLEQKGEGY